MQAMAEREEIYTLQGNVQADDAYLGGEHPGDKAGRGSENKVPFVAEVSLYEQHHPIYANSRPSPTSRAQPLLIGRETSSLPAAPC